MSRGDLNRKEVQGRQDNVYVWLIHFAVRPKLTQHCKATISQLKKKSSNNGFHRLGAYCVPSLVQTLDTNYLIESSQHCHRAGLIGILISETRKLILEELK